MRRVATAKLIVKLTSISVALSFSPVVTAAERASQDVPGFESDNQPIPEASCLACYGETLQQNGLDLRTRGSALKGGVSRPAVQSGSEKESLFFERFLSGSILVCYSTPARKAGSRTIWSCLNSAGSATI